MSAAAAATPASLQRQSETSLSKPAIPESSARLRGAQTPTREEIALLAYSIWQERGCPDGTAETDWLEAEQQLCQTR